MAKITIIQLVTPNIDEYAKYSVASVRKYALKHRYQYFIQRSKTLDDLHINWTKIDILKKALSEAPKGENAFVVLLDADTVIMDPERNIEYFIEQFKKDDTAIYMAADTPFRIDFKKKPNAGFIIVRNDETGRSIIDQWIHAAYNEGKQYNDTHPRNQLVYWNCVEPKVKDKQVVLPRYYFHKPLWWVPKPPRNLRFLYHITSTGGNTRADLMKAYYEKAWNDPKNFEVVEQLLKKHTSGFILVF